MSESGSSIAERHHALLRMMKTGACNCMPLTFDPVASHHAEDCRYRLLAEIHAALETADEFEGLTDRLSSLLDGVCIAFKGPHPPNGRHSWHDLPEIAAHMMRDREALRGDLHLLEIKRKQMSEKPETSLHALHFNVGYLLGLIDRYAGPLRNADA
jgi:hypothetical protein